MRFWLYPNPASEEARDLARRMAERLDGNVAPTPQEADLVIVLGGDGTVLRAVRMPGAMGKPLWTVNCGHLGYLSDCEARDAMQALEQVIAGAYRLEKRTRLDGRLPDGRPVMALNELLFHRGACVHTLGIRVEVNGSPALRFRGDGLLVCTPSGSTAYNLSAGGPVLMPEMELLALTPICPQTLLAAPIVISARDRVQITWRMALREEENERPDLTMDGQERLLLPLEGTLTLEEEIRRVSLVRTRDADFYGRLQQRMHWNAE